MCFYRPPLQSITLQYLLYRRLLDTASPSPLPSVTFQNTFECPPRANSVQKCAIPTVRMLKSLSHITALDQDKFRDEEEKIGQL